MRQHQTLHRQLVQLRGQAQDWAAGRPSGGFYPAIGICHNLSLSPASCAALGVDVRIKGRVPYIDGVRV